MRQAQSAFSTGLSPRVRGNRGEPECLLRAAGSIPACAGEPGIGWSCAGIGGVYPRVCGGTLVPLLCVPGHPGLSPRVRGNRFNHTPKLERAGSIPACAGEPCTSASAVCGASVYPRVCGGTVHPRLHRLPTYGLSPRVRGNQLKVQRVRVVIRSIPACAGEPRAGRQRKGQAWVYPRVCGGTPGARPASG